MCSMRWVSEEWFAWGWQTKLGSWFQKSGDTYQNKCKKNSCYITCNTHCWVMHIKQQTIISSPQWSSYYIQGPWGDEINFCCIICVTQRWALHGVIKWHFSTFIFAVFLPQSTAVIPVFQFWEQMATMLKLYIRSSSACDSALATNFIRIRQ